MIRDPLSPLKAACALVICGALLSACGSSSSPPPTPTVRTNLLSIIGDDHELQTNPSATLAAFRSLGVDVVRVNLFWESVAPQPDSAVAPAFQADDPAAYPASGWAIYDQIVRDAAADHIRVFLTLTGLPPLWASGSGAPDKCGGPCHQWMPSAADFGEFVHAVGVRYSGHFVPAGAQQPLPRVSFWSIWNEPNYGPNLAPQAIDGSKVEVSPRLYRALLDAAWSSLVATGHGPEHDTILIGETAPRGLTGPHLPGNFAGMLPLRFVLALYCVNADFAPLTGSAATLRGCPATAAASAEFRADNPALFEATGWADHPYPDAVAPDDASVDLPGYADFATLPDLEHTLDRSIAAYGADVQLPIYSTEFGYKTDPPYASGGIPMAAAAAYMNEAEYLSWRDRRIRSYDQYLLVDPSPTSGSDFVTGLEFANGTPKSTLDAFRMPLWMPVTRAPAGTRLQVWGCVRPAPAVAHATGMRQEVNIQLERSGADAFHTVFTAEVGSAGGCYFDADVPFSAGGPVSGTVRLQWRDAQQTFYSRVQAISLN